MLASITPLGERGRHNHYAVTVVAFLTGCVVAGGLLGAGLGALGALTLGGVGVEARELLLAAALLLALASDLRPGAVPGPRRQVNERWREEFRGWVYGAGYGAQLGLGAATVITSAATYVTLLAAWLSASAPAGALVLGGYGVIRGLTPLLGARVGSPEQLLLLHSRLARGEPRAVRGGYALLAVGAALALIGALA